MSYAIRIETTKKWIGEFEEALKVTRETGPAPNIHEKIWKAQCAALSSMVEDLQSQLMELECLARMELEDTGRAEDNGASRR